MSFSAIFVPNRVDFALRSTMQQFAIFAKKVVKKPLVVLSGGSFAYILYMDGMNKNIASCESDMKTILGKGPSLKAGGKYPLCSSNVLCYYFQLSDASLGGGGGGAGGGSGKPDVVKELIAKYSGFIQQVRLSRRFYHYSVHGNCVCFFSWASLVSWEPARVLL